MTHQKQILYIGLFIVITLSFQFGLLKNDLNHILYAGIVDKSFLTKFSYIDSFFGFLTPIFLLIFYIITGYIMIVLADVDKPIKDFIQYLPIGFLPALLSTSLAYFVLTSIDSSVYFKLNDKTISPSEVKGIFSISLTDLKLITTLCYGYIYVHMTIVLIKKYNLTILKSIIVSITPSIIVFIVRLLLT
jgi:hypothetical protein